MGNPHPVEDANTADPYSLVKLIANLMEWTKWTLDEIKATPIRPIMLIMDALQMQREEMERNPQDHMPQGSVDLGQPQQWANRILNDPTRYQDASGERNASQRRTR